MDPVLKALKDLVAAAESYHDASGHHFSDTDYDRDGGLAEADAELSVAALPAAREAIRNAEEGESDG